MVNEVVTALVILTGLGLLFATIIAVAYKKLRVYEDPRIDQVEEMLPGANCGACSMPGCRVFAEKVISGELNVGKCTVSSANAIEDIAAYLGVEASTEEKRVARVLCAGGANEAHSKAEYTGGLKTCRGEAIVAGGVKECNWGCLGLGDCADVCDFDAIHMSADALPVVDVEKCTACGDCVDICPKNLFEIMPIGQQLLVQCKSLLEGEMALERCSVACNACGICAMQAAPGVIEMVNNLPVINYELNALTTSQTTVKCPTGAIVWLESGKQFDVNAATELPLGRIDAPYRSEQYYQ